MYIEAASAFGIDPAALLSMDTVNELAALAPFVNALFTATKPAPEDICLDWEYDDYVSPTLRAEWMDLIRAYVEEEYLFPCDDCATCCYPAGLCDKCTVRITAKIWVYQSGWTSQSGFSSMDEAQKWAERKAVELYR
jgi:hypothetical protein